MITFGEGKNKEEFDYMIIKRKSLVNTKYGTEVYKGDKSVFIMEGMFCICNLVTGDIDYINTDDVIEINFRKDNN